MGNDLASLHPEYPWAYESTSERRLHPVVNFSQSLHYHLGPEINEVINHIFLEPSLCARHCSGC